MTIEIPQNRIQEIIQRQGDITADQMLEIMETATPEEREDIWNIVKPGDDYAPNIPQEE